MKAIGYARVSTREQGNSGLGLEAQREKIRKHADYREWELGDILTDDGVSGTVSPWKRPAMRTALEALKAGQADALIVAKLDRASRSSADFAALMKASRDQGWGLVMLDLDLDTTKPTGRFVAQIMAAVAELEAELIRERTRDALAVRKSQGHRLGEPPRVPGKVRREITRRRADGATLQSIADVLNRRGEPTVKGGKRWHHSTVAAVLASTGIDQEMAAIRRRAS